MGTFVLQTGPCSFLKSRINPWEISFPLLCFLIPGALIFFPTGLAPFLSPPAFSPPSLFHPQAQGAAGAQARSGGWRQRCCRRASARAQAASGSGSSGRQRGERKRSARGAARRGPRSERRLARGPSGGCSGLGEPEVGHAARLQARAVAERAGAARRSAEEGAGERSGRG
jgi:hypothetical protein